MDEAGQGRMGYRAEHDWGGLIRIVDPDGLLVAVLEKHASGRPGSGISADTHAKLQGERAELMVAALNAPSAKLAPAQEVLEVAEKTEGGVDPWVIMDKLRMQHSDEIHKVWMPLVAELREAAKSAEETGAALRRIAERLDGLWYDPAGDVESDIRSVIESLGQAGPANPEAAVVKRLVVEHSASVAGLSANSPEEVPAPSLKEVAVADGQVKYDLNELAEFALEHFHSKCGQVIRVRDYADASGYYGGTRIDEMSPFGGYELALVLPTQEKDVVVDDFDHEGYPMIRGTWSLAMLTGQHAGMRCFAHGPVFYFDGSVSSDDMMLPTASRVGNVTHPKLSHQDLLDLAWEDARRFSGAEVYVGACMGYVGDTDDQEHITLYPPAVAVVHSYTREIFERNAQIRDHMQDNDVLDWDLDFVSEDPRLSGHRATYCGAPSYYQDGRRDANDLREEYDPTNEEDLTPTFSTMR